MTVPHDSRMAARRHEMLADIADTIAKQLLEHGIPQAGAELIGIALADHLAAHWGGQVFSFPKDAAFIQAQRDLEVYQAFTGDNYDVLALRYGLSERSVRALVARVRAKLQRAGQPGLFDQG